MSQESELNLLSSIARDYHLAGNEPDMRIESLVQTAELRQIDRLIPDSCKLLEMGFGDGITFSQLAGRTEYSLVEAVPDLVALAKARAISLGVNATFHQSLFEDFRPDTAYDVVFASHVLEHVENPSEILRKVKSWLSPTGVVIIIVPNAESIHRRLGVAVGFSKSIFDLSARDNLVGHRRVYTLENLRDELAKNDFEVVHEAGSFLKPLPNGQLLGLTDESITHLCAASSVLPPELMANLIVVARASGHTN